MTRQSNVLSCLIGFSQASGAGRWSGPWTAVASVMLVTRLLEEDPMHESWQLRCLKQLQTVSHSPPLTAEDIQGNKHQTT